MRWIQTGREIGGRKNVPTSTIIAVLAKSGFVDVVDRMAWALARRLGATKSRRKPTPERLRAAFE